MKKSAIVLSLSVLLLLAACSGAGDVPRTPAGDYAFGSDSFQLGRNGSFRLAHEASAEDRRDYAVTGTYAFTLESRDEDNRISYGKIDITVTGLLLAGAAVETLDIDPDRAGDDVAVGDALLGWWKYMDRIPSGGKMNLGFNLASTGYRPEDVYTGRDCLFLGDPVER